MNPESRQPAEKFRVELLVSPRHNSLLTSSFVSGLGALARSGQIVLSIAGAAEKRTNLNVLELSIGAANSREKQWVAVDYADRSDVFCADCLERADVYFKRNFWSSATRELPDGLRHKVRPAGITFGSYVPGTRRHMVRCAVTALAGRLRRPSAYSPIRAARRFLRELEEIRCFLAESDWERDGNDQAQARVVFQTRLWNPEDNPEIDRSEINRARIALARGLRAEFGSLHTIGLLDTDWARVMAPDALLVDKVSRREYAQQLRTSTIAVNSSGLDGSIGFKVAESLAAGCALVSEPLHVELPVPLKPGVNYLPFEGPDDCVRQVRRLLDDPELTEQMRGANLRYYHDNIKPAAMARNLLERAYSSSLARDPGGTGVYQTLRQSLSV